MLPPSPTASHKAEESQAWIPPLARPTASAESESREDWTATEPPVTVVSPGSTADAGNSGSSVGLGEQFSVVENTNELEPQESLNRNADRLDLPQPLQTKEDGGCCLVAKDEAIDSVPSPPSAAAAAGGRISSKPVLVVVPVRRTSRTIKRPLPSDCTADSKRTKLSSSAV